MSPKTKEVGNVYVVSVNDAFVMKAWGKQMDPNGDSGVSLALIAVA
jgi:peroxiredoxin 5